VAHAGAVYVSNGPISPAVTTVCSKNVRKPLHCQGLFLATQSRFGHRYTDVQVQPSVTSQPCSFVQANSSTLQMEKHVPTETSSVHPPNCSLNSATCRLRAQATQRGRVCKLGEHSQLPKCFQKRGLSWSIGADTTVTNIGIQFQCKTPIWFLELTDYQQ